MVKVPLSARSTIGRESEKPIWLRLLETACDNPFVTTGFGGGVLQWCTTLACCGMLVAQPRTAEASTSEREEVLFVLSPPPGSQGAVALLWVPQPMQRYCVGRTLQ